MRRRYFRLPLHTGRFIDYATGYDPFNPVHAMSRWEAESHMLWRVFRSSFNYPDTRIRTGFEKQ